MYPSTSFQCVLTSIALKAEFLVELCLVGSDLRSIENSSNPNFSLTNLRKLSIVQAFTANQPLELLLSRHCLPSIQYLSLSLLIPTEWISIATDLPTLETISITNQDGWYFHNGYFPRLKYLNLERTRLHADSFAFFASNYMPSLEKLSLSDCNGFQEFNLSNPSIKHLHIIGLKELIKATIDAPNLVYLKLSLPICSQLTSLSFAPISTEWTSYIDVTFSLYTYNQEEVLLRNIALNELLKALSQSRITLQLHDDHCRRSFVEGPVTYNIGSNKPFIVVEHFRLMGPYSYSNVQVLFNSWFRAFRPRYVYDIYNQGMEVFEIIWKVLVHDTESSWSQDLVEVSVETSYGDHKEWHPFHGNSFSKSAALANNQRVHLRLKWRD